MQIGLVGLGTMGEGLARRLIGRGFEVFGCDLSGRARTAADRVGVQHVTACPDELMQHLDVPRIVWLMLPAGDSTVRSLAELTPLLDSGDLVVDGGNSDFRESRAHAEALGLRGVDFVDVGVSGGRHGWVDGYGLMVGGTGAAVQRLGPVLEALGHAGQHVHVGASGSGHLVKAVHNAVQYGVMEAYAEGFALLEALEGVDAREGMRAWQQGSSIRSWLLAQMITTLDRGLDHVEGDAVVPDSGMGRWTGMEALRLGVPTPVLSLALQARFASQGSGREANRLLAATRAHVGGHR